MVGLTVQHIHGGRLSKGALVCIMSFAVGGTKAHVLSCLSSSRWWVGAAGSDNGSGSLAEARAAVKKRRKEAEDQELLLPLWLRRSPQPLPPRVALISYA